MWEVMGKKWLKVLLVVVKRPVYMVPHGVDPEWYSAPGVWETAPVKALNPVLIDLYLYKIRKNKRFLLFWL